MQHHSGRKEHSMKKIISNAVCVNYKDRVGNEKSQSLKVRQGPDHECSYMPS